jgi:S1-C subfamily serine protease
MRLLGLGCGCALLSLHLMAAAEEPSKRPAPETIPAPRAKPAANSGMPKLRISQRSLETLGTDDALAPEVNAGVIARPALRAELSRGIGSFLQQVRTEPAFSRGRFAGWRVLDLFSRRSDVHVKVLRPGDTVARVNGRPVERPEDLVALWSSLGSASELVLDIQRAGHASKLRYTIAD